MVYNVAYNPKDKSIEGIVPALGVKLLGCETQNTSYDTNSLAYELFIYMTMVKAIISNLLIVIAFYLLLFVHSSFIKAFQKILQH